MPGNNSLSYPEGYAKKLPKGTNLVFQIHYTPNGKATTDQTKLALVFAKEKPRYEVHVSGLANPAFTIPAGADNHKVSATAPGIPFDARVLALFPHAHLRGRSFRYELIHPDGREEILLDVPRYDFNWQHRYVLAEPRRIAKGSRLRVTATYDNSADNPANPDPDSEVRTGTQSWEEMFNGYFDVVLADEDLTAPRPWGERAWQAAAVVGRPGVALLACAAGGLYLGRKRIAKALRRS